MSNPTPLNPDALEEASNTVRRIALGEVNSWDVAEAAITAYLTVAQPEVNSVESIPAKMRILMWEGGEVEVGEIPDGYVLVGFEMETDRAWSMADKVTINIERPEVKP